MIVFSFSLGMLNHAETADVGSTLENAGNKLAGAVGAATGMAPAPGPVAESPLVGMSRTSSSAQFSACYGVRAGFNARLCYHRVQQ